MNRKITAMILTVITVTTLTGCAVIRITDNTESAVGKMEEIRAWNTADSTDNIEIYYTRTQADFDRLTEILENRNGKMIIEVSDGVVLDDDGNGSDCLGNYIRYEKEFSKGDRVQSVFVYNPENNAIDDIVYRYDFLIE